MSNEWESFCFNNRIREIYENCSIQSLPQSVFNLAQEWLKNPKSMILFGACGSGKTYFMMCLMKELTMKGLVSKISFKKSRRLAQEIDKYLFFEKDLTKLTDEIFSCDYFFLDNLGVEKECENVETEFMEIIDDRNQGVKKIKYTMITTNLSPQKIEMTYGSRFLSRLKRYEWVEFCGEDRRGQ